MSEKRISCDTCDVEFPSQEKLDLHIQKGKCSLKPKLDSKSNLELDSKSNLELDSKSNLEIDNKSNLALNDIIPGNLKKQNKIYDKKQKENSIVKIQALWRGFIVRAKRLPNFLYIIQEYLTKLQIKISKKTDDGRINSVMDEDTIIKKLQERFPDRIIKPSKRMWFDILIFDLTHKWLPVNIKSTTTTTNDNAGNLTMCAYAYTNIKIDLTRKNTYQNGTIAPLLLKALQEKNLNRNIKKDYYFIVINKTNSKEIIINSLKGLSKLTPNINNLPFQIKWVDNKEYKYECINKKINIFILCLQKPKPSWQEKFMFEIRNLEI